jgi:hypothetical protein
MGAALMALLVVGPVHGADYYVDPAQGSDTNPGSLAAP